MPQRKEGQGGEEAGVKRMLSLQFFVFYYYDYFILFTSLFTGKICCNKFHSTGCAILHLRRTSVTLLIKYFRP